MTMKRGFTLIELLATLAIISILGLVAMPVIEISTQRIKEQELRRSLREIRNAIDAYKRAVEEGRVQRNLSGSPYPKTLNVLVEGVEDEKSPVRAKIYFLRRIPRDPFDSESNLSASDTWGLRSYLSSPDHPLPGDDVFDVYTKSGKTGLNGIPYKQW